MTDYKNHKHYETCRRAYYNVSFSPDKRAISECEYFDAQLEEFKELCGDNVERYNDISNKFESKFLAHMHAKSRCLSSMITGPANFPVRRAEKANESEHKRLLELLEFVDKVKKAIDKEKNPIKYGISSDDPDAIELLEKKVESLKNAQSSMKKFNKIVRDKEGDKIERIKAVTGFSDETISRMMKPNYMGRVGFESFELSNNLANIKRLEGRIKELKNKEARGHSQTEINGVKIVENVEANRVQLIFDGKPEPEVREKLKRNGFRWSPHFGAWQRHLNSDGISKARSVCEAL